MRKFLAAGVAALIAVMMAAGTVSAHTGSIEASKDCQTGQVRVSLNNNVTIDRTVDVVTTIPGTTGISGGHYNTTGNTGSIVIWQASGPQPFEGKVDLYIYNGNHQQEFHASKTVTKEKDCPEVTPTPTATPTETPVVTPTAGTPTPASSTLILTGTPKVTLPPTSTAELTSVVKAEDSLVNVVGGLVVIVILCWFIIGRHLRMRKNRAV